MRCIYAVRSHTQSDNVLAKVYKIMEPGVDAARNSLQQAMKDKGQDLPPETQLGKHAHAKVYKITEKDIETLLKLPAWSRVPLQRRKNQFNMLYNVQQVEGENVDDHFTLLPLSAMAKYVAPVMADEEQRKQYEFIILHLFSHSYCSLIKTFSDLESTSPQHRRLVAQEMSEMKTLCDRLLSDDAPEDCDPLPFWLLMCYMKHVAECTEEGNAFPNEFVHVLNCLRGPTHVFTNLKYPSLLAGLTSYSWRWGQLGVSNEIEENRALVYTGLFSMLLNDPRIGYHGLRNHAELIMELITHLMQHSGAQRLVIGRFRLDCKEITEMRSLPPPSVEKMLTLGAIEYVGDVGQHKYAMFTGGGNAIRAFVAAALETWQIKKRLSALLLKTTKIPIDGKISHVVYCLRDLRALANLAAHDCMPQDAMRESLQNLCAHSVLGWRLRAGRASFRIENNPLDEECREFTRMGTAITSATACSRQYSAALYVFVWHAVLMARAERNRAGVFGMFGQPLDRFFAMAGLWRDAGARFVIDGNCVLGLFRPLQLMLQSQGKEVPVATDKQYMNRFWGIIIGVMRAFRRCCTGPGHNNVQRAVMHMFLRRLAAEYKEDKRFAVISVISADTDMGTLLLTKWSSIWPEDPVPSDSESFG